MNTPEVVEDVPDNMCSDDAFCVDPNCPAHAGKLATPESAGEPLAEVVLPELDVTEQDIESAKTLRIPDSLQPDNLTDMAAWWVKLFTWFGGAVRSRERQLLSSLRTIEQLRKQLKDTSAVHVNILRGEIALTKAQAIHIAGLPADIEEQLKTTQEEIGTWRWAVGVKDKQIIEFSEAIYSAQAEIAALKAAR